MLSQLDENRVSLISLDSISFSSILHFTVYIPRASTHPVTSALNLVGLLGSWICLHKVTRFSNPVGIIVIMVFGAAV
jgi:hypothetical protein